MALQSKTILLVDDEPFILSATAQLLRAAGHEVHTCQEWAGVASVMRHEKPDVVLMDYNMPALKGDDLCMILKRNMTDGDTKIIIFSSEPEPDLVQIVASCGADGYIKKNVAGHILLKEIEGVLETAMV
jgi:CheY-like chemotaxis protein